ncbi:hypothetical protein D3C81_1743220 [compost metagenome]
MSVSLFDQRSDFRWFDHYGTAGGQRRCELPGAGDQGEVPRHDQADNTHRFKTRVGGETGYGQRHLTILQIIQPFGQTGVIAERSDGIIDIHHGFVARLAVVLHLQRDQCLATQFDLFGETLQIGCTLGRTAVAPSGKRLTRGGDGLIDL